MWNPSKTHASEIPMKFVCFKVTVNFYQNFLVRADRNPGYVLFHKSVNMWSKTLLTDRTKNPATTVWAHFQTKDHFVVLQKLLIHPKMTFTLKLRFKQAFWLILSGKNSIFVEYSINIPKTTIFDTFLELPVQGWGGNMILTSSIPKPNLCPETPLGHPITLIIVKVYEIVIL